MKKIEIYTTNYCPFCVKAKSLLKKKNIKFSEIDVSNDEALREKMTTMANGARSVPQIFADNVHIGDCDKLYKLDQEKKLDKFPEELKSKNKPKNILFQLRLITVINLN